MLDRPIHLPLPPTDNAHSRRSERSCRYTSHLPPRHISAEARTLTNLTTAFFPDDMSVWVLRNHTTQEYIRSRISPPGDPIWLDNVGETLALVLQRIYYKSSPVCRFIVPLQSRWIRGCAFIATVSRITRSLCSMHVLRNHWLIKRP